MQLQHLRMAAATGLPVAGLLWSGLAIAGLGLLAEPVSGRAGGLPLTLALLTLFVAAIVATFSLRYMRADPRSARFFLLLGLLVAAVLAWLFAGNVLTFALAWCASGWLLAALIGHAGGGAEGDGAVRRTRLAFLAGDAALVGALAILAWHAQSLTIDAAVAGAATLSWPLATVAAVLLVIAAAARCALPPFSGWLLSSMTAPTPVSALMHAGLVNAGGFLLIRMAPVLEAAPAARLAAVGLGLGGALYGIGIMLVRPDVKRSLAGSTVSQMGFMIMSCGLGAYAAALWHIVAHGLFKAWLFLGSGSTIGMKPAATAGQLSRPLSLAVAGVTAGAALALVASGKAEPSLVPLLLGAVTAMATLASCFAGKAPVRTRIALLAGIAVLVAFHGLGLALSERAVAGDAPALVPGWALLVLLGAFLGLWLWQQQRLAAGRGLPLPLYVHFINAGALHPLVKGDDK